MNYAIGNKYQLILSNDLQKFEYNSVSMDLPSLSLDSPEVNFKSVINRLSADTLIFDTITIEAFVDAEFLVYREIIKYFLKGVNSVSKGTNNWNPSEYPFDGTIIIMDNKFTKLFSIRLINVRLTGVDSPKLKVTDTEEFLIMPVSISYEDIEIL